MGIKTGGGENGKRAKTKKGSEIERSLKTREESCGGSTGTDKNGMKKGGSGVPKKKREKNQEQKNRGGMETNFLGSAGACYWH